MRTTSKQLLSVKSVYKWLYCTVLTKHLECSIASHTQYIENCLVDRMQVSVQITQPDLGGNKIAVEK